MHPLSKSKLIAYRQCPKRLWLEVHRPDLREDSAQTQARFQTGYQVGDIAKHLYDHEGKGAVIDVDTEGYEGLAKTAAGWKLHELKAACNAEVTATTRNAVDQWLAEDDAETFRTIIVPNENRRESAALV